MVLFFQLSWIVLVTALVSYVCAVETLSEKELLAACEATSNEHFRAPVRWDLLEVQPPQMLVTKALFLEYARIQCYLVDDDHKKKSGDAGPGQSSQSNESAVSDHLCFIPETLLQSLLTELLRRVRDLSKIATKTRIYPRRGDALACSPFAPDGGTSRVPRKPERAQRTLGS